MSCSVAPVSPAVLEVVEQGSSNRSSTANDRPLTQLASSSVDSEKLTVKVPKPSGIGLHLNSIVNGMEAGSGATVSVKSTERGNLSICGKKLTSMVSCHPSKNMKNCLISSNVVGSNLTSGDNDGRHESYVPNTESVSASFSLNNAKPLNDTVLLKPTEHTSSHKRKFNSEHIDSPMDYNLSSPQKKRQVCLLSLEAVYLHLSAYFLQIICLCNSERKPRMEMLVMGANAAIVRRLSA